MQDPPKTWDELIDRRSKMEAGQHRGPGRRLRGLHGLVQLADPVGGRRRSSRRPTRRRCEEEPTQAGARDHLEARELVGGRPVDRQLQSEDSGPPRVREGGRVLPGQLPVHLSERRRTNKAIFQEKIGWAPYPRGRRRQARQGADRRLQLGRRRLHQAPRRGLRRGRLPAQRAQPARRRRQGRAAARRSRRSTTTRTFKKDYPFADLIRDSIDTGAVRPRDAAVRRRVAGDLRPRCRRPTASTSRSMAWRRLKQAVQDALDGEGPELMATPAAPPSSTLSERARAERKLGWHAVRAGGARDARRHRVPDPVRVLAVAAARRPALPRRQRVRRPRQLRHGARRRAAGGRTSATR